MRLWRVSIRDNEIISSNFFYRQRIDMSCLSFSFKTRQLRALAKKKVTISDKENPPPQAYDAHSNSEDDEDLQGYRDLADLSAFLTLLCYLPLDRSYLQKHVSMSHPNGRTGHRMRTFDIGADHR
jgi:hypothetical protein